MKAKSFENSKSQDVKTQFEASGMNLTVSSNVLYFNFMNSRLKPWETINVSNLQQNNVNIALANYVIKQLKSIYLYPSVLMVGVYQTHWNQITKLVSITLVSITSVSWIRFASGNYLLKPGKWNKEKVISTCRSYIKVMLRSCIRLTLGSYVIKPQ